MNSISDYKIDVSRWELFFHGGPLAFTDTNHRTRNIASVAMNLVAKLFLGLASFGIFTLLRVISVDKYGNKQDVYIRDEIDRITAMVDVKRLKRVSEEAKEQHAIKAPHVDYYSIYLRGVMTQKKLISEPMDLEECFSDLGEIEFPEQWKAALRAADLYSDQLASLNSKKELSSFEEVKRLKLFEKREYFLTISKDRLEKMQTRSELENNALKATDRKLNEMSEAKRFNSVTIALKYADSHLEQLIELDLKEQLTESEELEREKLLKEYTDCLTDVKNEVEKLQDKEPKERLLKVVDGKFNEIKQAEERVAS